MIKKSGFAPGKYLNIKTSKIRKIVKSLYLLVFYIFTYLRSGFDSGRIKRIPPPQNPNSLPHFGLKIKPYKSQLYQGVRDDSNTYTP